MNKQELKEQVFVADLKEGYTIEPPKTLQVTIKNYDSTVFKTKLPEDEAMKLIDGWKGTKGGWDGMIKPDYYHNGSIDVIKFAEENFAKDEIKGFYRMNVLKYVTRFDKKGSALTDLEKASFYLNKLKEITEENE